MEVSSSTPPPQGVEGKSDSADQKSELRPAPACPSIPVTAIPPHLGAPGSSTAGLEAAWWVMDTVGADACNCQLLRATRGFSFLQKRQAGTRKGGEGRASPCPAQSQRRLCFSSCYLCVGYCSLQTRTNASPKPQFLLNLNRDLSTTALPVTFRSLRDLMGKTCIVAFRNL